MRVDVEQVCTALQEVQGELSPPCEEQLRDAALALTFIKDSGHIHNFEDYLDGLGRVTVASRLPTFEARHAAEAWLRSHRTPPDATLVVIGGARHCVAYSLRHGEGFLIRTPSREELSSAGGGLGPGPPSGQHTDRPSERAKALPFIGATPWGTRETAGRECWSGLDLVR